MLNFLKNRVEERFVNFKKDEPIAVFLDRSDALFYSQYHSLYNLERVNCVIPPDFKYEDENFHNLSMVRILLKKPPFENDNSSEVELWCSDGFAESAIFAYAYHTEINGGTKENFEIEMTSVDFFDFNNDDYNGAIKKATSSQMITQILSCVNQNNYELVRALLEYCYEGEIYDLESLQKMEIASFSIPETGAIYCEEQKIELAERKLHGISAIERFNPCGEQANAYYQRLLSQAKTDSERKTALILLCVIRKFDLCFPTFAYEMITNGVAVPNP